MLPDLPIATSWQAIPEESQTSDPAGSPAISCRSTIAEPLAGGRRYRARLTNQSSAAVAVDTICPVVIDGAAGWLMGGLSGWAVWLHGRWMFSDALTHRFGRHEYHPDFGESFRQVVPEGIAYRSDGVMLLYQPASRQALLIGFTSTARQFGEVVLTCTADERHLIRIEARCLIEGRPLGPGDALESEDVVILAGDDPDALMARYAQQLANTMSARVPDRVPGGWCSWYYYYHQATERDVRRNLHALTKARYPLDYVQVDDGYQSATGDWLTPNEKFPHGMKSLAGEIQAAGYLPGLWLAPLVMHRTSRVLADHPEFAVRDRRGRIHWTKRPGPWAILDCTLPAAQDWLTNVIRTVVHDWGYRVLKIDELDDACLPEGRYHDPTATSARNLRLGLEIVRAAAGDDIFLIGCSCPFGPAVGLVDAMRVGDDTAARWQAGLKPGVKLSLRLGLQRFWMHGRLWSNDPDMLLVRRGRSRLTETEVRFLATAIAISGGLAGVSDNLTVLPEDRADLLRRVLPSTGQAARPLDLWTRETPMIWHLPRPDGGLIIFLNWDDEPVDLAVDLHPLGLAGAHRVIERWTGAERVPPGGWLEERAIPPHGARVLRFYREAGPVDLGQHLLA